MNDILKMDFHAFSDNNLHLLFKIVSTLNHAKNEELMQFLERCPWPQNTVSPNKFKRVFSNLADKDLDATKEWLFRNMAGAQDLRLHQILSAFIGLIERDVSSLSRENLSFLYKVSQKDEDMYLSFVDIVGLLIYVDRKLASSIFDELLKSKKHDVKTHAILSLSRCVRDHLDFVLEQGDRVIAISGLKDNFGLLHCLLIVLKDYRGEQGYKLLERIDTWFPYRYLSSLQDEKTLAELLMILKIHAKENPKLIFDISKRCPVISKGVAGALSALYANIVIYTDDPEDLSYILSHFMKLAKFKQRRIRNALKTTIPLLAEKIGSKKVFDIFFNIYKELDDVQALEDLVKAIIGISDWSKEETEILLADLTLPAQVRSLLYSRIYA